MGVTSEPVKSVKVTVPRRRQTGNIPPRRRRGRCNEQGHQVSLWCGNERERVQGIITIWSNVARIDAALPIDAVGQFVRCVREVDDAVIRRVDAMLALLRLAAVPVEPTTDVDTDVVELVSVMVDDLELAPHAPTFRSAMPIAA